MAALICGASLSLQGCSALVSPQSDDDVRCEVIDGADPCVGLGQGLRCSASGRCERCSEQPEACDGIDNDCDGDVDEGHDQDGDGVTWCGEGVLEYRDCDDNSSAVYPAVGRSEAAPELCDGADNDCDSAYDEGCASENCSTEGCPSGTRCDERSGRCIGSRSLGGTCESDAECGSDFCIDSALLLLPESVGERVCARACCSDEDCPDLTLCAVGVDGLRACVPSRDGQRREAGAECLSSMACASQACVGGECARTCAREADCGDAFCALGGGSAAPFGAAFACGSAAGNGEVFALCTSWDLVACQTGFCLDGACAQPCAGDQDCPSGMRCDYRSAIGGLSLSTAWLPVCVPESDAASPTLCCSNKGCPGEFNACRPALEDRRWSMRCSSGF